MIVQPLDSGTVWTHTTFSSHHTTVIANYATAEDFATWEAKAKTMSDAELLWSAQDARRAAEAMRGWNPIAEGRYDDEAHTYGDEIRRRRANR